MFDLTKEIKLNHVLHKKYMIARTTLYIIFVIGVLIVVDKILFPSQELNLFLDNLNAAKNTIVNPRIGESKIPSKGLISKNETLTFNANPIGNFSSMQVIFQSTSDNNLSESEVTVQKSYQAFFYPTGKPLGFKSGSLLTTEDGNYYIVSSGKLRRFDSPDVILALGYPKSSFALVSENDLRFNQIGDDVVSTDSYPDDTLFTIDGKFYQLGNESLLAFVSDRAFLSQYQSIQAIAKDKSFFNKYPVSLTPLGFSDGTIASSGNSAYILSNGKSYPIADFSTFESMGFSWDNVIALESDELGAYEQQKQFTINQPHPDGTIFADKDKDSYFMIDNGQKRPIPSQAILKTYNFQNSISVNEDKSSKKLSCKLEKKILPLKSFACEIKLDEIANSIGNDYQLTANLNNNTKLKEINLNFSTPLSWKNMMTSLSKIKGNLQNNYGSQ